MSIQVKNSFQWNGTNFPDLYEWLTKNSISKNFKLKIVEPGSKTSEIKITVDDIHVVILKIGDWIVRNENYEFCKFE